MNEQTNNNLYEAETILSYLSGKMNREEIRKFEYALLDDDLLADAVEGYRLLQKSMGDDAILAKVENVKNTTKTKDESGTERVVKMSAFRWINYAVAASLVVAAGWWLFSLSRPEAILPEEAGSSTLLVRPEEKENNESVATIQENVPSEYPRETVPAKENAGTAKKSREVAEKAADLSNIKESPTSLNDAAHTLPQNMPPPDAKMIEKVKAEQEAKARRIMPSSVQSAMQYRFTWDFADSVRVSPKNGWHVYRKFLAEQFTPIAPLEIAAIAILTIEESGKVYSVKFEGPVTEEEKSKLEKAIKTGPEWINHTRTKQETSIQWQ